NGEPSERNRKLSGRPTSQGEVAGAVANKPISLLIPWQRVVAAKGIGGYAGGTDRKLWLLNLERN
ncbi:MGMT family protein, partial [Muribaculaceae bacterium Isolate-001 (NCI)]